ncbi:MAG: DUF4870 domain-containing protein [Syntrophomonadaceae bacterium]|jgi:uncharacterized Tic20 family protein|nr:DUF4870 domain-containing protein [Syntrophomonadaceae bacterium]
MVLEEQKNRNWAMGCHLAALALYIGIPFGNIFGPLIIWLIKKDEIPLVDEQGKESLNFQISLILYGVAMVILIALFSFTIVLIPLAAVLAILLMAIGLVNLVLIIYAALKVSNGESFSYPLAIKFFK